MDYILHIIKYIDIYALFIFKKQAFCILIDVLLYTDIYLYTHGHKKIIINLNQISLSDYHT